MFAMAEANFELRISGEWTLRIIVKQTGISIDCRDVIFQVKVTFGQVKLGLVDVLASRKIPQQLLEFGLSVKVLPGVELLLGQIKLVLSVQFHLSVSGPAPK